MTRPRITALITGATSGIGAAFGRALAGRGYHLILVARHSDTLAKTATDLHQRYGVSSDLCAADLSCSSDIERVAQMITAAPPLDILINSAGFGVPGTFADIPMSRHYEMIHVHMTASMQLCYAALPGMRARGRGTIINVSSLAALVQMSDLVTYSATKRAIVRFSETLQQEVASDGIRVQALCPGITRTGFHQTPEFANFDHQSIPEHRWMSADAVAAAALQSLGHDTVICIPGRRNRLDVILHRLGLDRVRWRLDQWGMRR